MHVFTLNKFASILKDYSQGKINAQIHYRGSKDFPAFGGEEDNVWQLMRNPNLQFHVSVVAVGNASSRIPVLEFLMLPYLFENKQAAEKLFKSDFMKDGLNRKLKKRYNVRVLGWLIGGFRHLTNSVKPVKSIDDLAGLRIRTPRNRLMEETYWALGARAKPVLWSKTFDALAKGQVDGQENPFNVIYYSKFWDAKQKYLTLNGPFLWVGPILISEPFYATLTTKQQEIISKAATDATHLQWRWIDERTEEYKKKLREKGILIHQLADREKWVKATRHLWPAYYPKIGINNEKRGRAFVDRVLSIIDE